MKTREERCSWQYNDIMHINTQYVQIIMFFILFVMHYEFLTNYYTRIDIICCILCHVYSFDMTSIE